MSWMHAKLELLLQKVEASVQFPWVMATGCCRYELESVRSSTYDWRRLGIMNQALHASEADLLIVAGWINPEFKEEIIAAYSRLVGRRSVIAVGACAISGSPYKCDGDKRIVVSDFLPVDVYVPGCPPRPEAILDALRLLKKRIHPEPDQRTILHEALRETPRGD